MTQRQKILDYLYEMERYGENAGGAVTICEVLKIKKLNGFNFGKAEDSDIIFWDVITNSWRLTDKGLKEIGKAP